MKKIGILVAFVGLFGLAFWLLNTDFGSGKRVSAQEATLRDMKDSVKNASFGISPYWLERYHIELSSPEDVSLDSDNDGLDLLGEYTYLTDPFDADTDKDGYTDGQEVKNGYSPTGNGLIDKNKNGVSDTWELAHRISIDQDESGRDNDLDGLTNKEEFLAGTDPNQRDTDLDGFSDSQEIQNGYDPDAPGDARPTVEVFIPKINVVVPMIFSQNSDEDSIQKDLEKGSILYPNTAIPGQKGNAIVTAHSSNYAWATGEYNSIFKNLGDMNIGDTIVFRFIQKNGQERDYTYVVNERFVTSPDDARIFEETDDATVTLVTCWPIHTSWKRLILKATLQ